MITDVKPSFTSIQTTSGSTVGSVAYNSSFAYNSSQPYGGFGGGQSTGPNNGLILNPKGHNSILSVKPNL